MRGSTARIRRAVREFLLLPAAVVAVYVGVGVLSIAADKAPPPWFEPLQHQLAQLISRNAASALLSGIATSVVTVTSITFSVLLLAVQQTASSMTPAVFDQFLRRRTNQLYLGMFVGLSLFSFLVLASIGPKATPAFGATLALLLTVISFGVLVVLIYSTVDQMRPASVTQVIHDRALRARITELELLRRTRREPQADGPIRITVHAEQDGYVTGLALEDLVGAIPDSPRSEVVLSVTLGAHVAFGQAVGTVVDDEAAVAERTAAALRRAIQLDRSRDLDTDASFAVDQLGNIAWTALSSSKHNPQTGRDAVDRLRDLGSRWAPRDDPRADATRTVPVVYEDRDLDHLLDTLLGCLVVAGESKQAASAAHVVHAISDVISAAPVEHVDAVEPALARTLGVVRVHALTRPLEQALRRMAECLDELGRESTAEHCRDLIETMSSLGHAGRPPS